MFNEVNCFIDSKNTGFARCVAKLGKLTFDIFAPPSLRIKLSDLADKQGFFTDLLTEDSVALRSYLLGPWATVEDGSTDPVRESFDGGVDTTLYDGASILSRRIIKGGTCAHMAVRKFNGTQDQFSGFHVFKSLDSSDALFYIAGKKVWNLTTKEWEMAPYGYDDIWAPARKIATGSTGETYMLRTVMGDVTQMNESLILLPVNFDVSALPRINDVEITVVKSATGVFDISAVMSCGNSNLTTLYPQLADPDAIIVTNNAGTVVPVTGVTIVNSKFRVALDTADAAYTAGTSFNFAFESISVLAAAPFNIEWIESNTVSGILK